MPTSTERELQIGGTATEETRLPPRAVVVLCIVVGQESDRSTYRKQPNQLANYYQTLQLLFLRQEPPTLLPLLLLT